MNARPLLLVVPAFNPGPEFEQFLPDLAGQLKASGHPHRILVVDDGSGAEPRARIQKTVARAATPSGSVELRVLPRNEGKGAAIMAGWAEADPAVAWLGFVDADGSVPAREVVRVLAEARCLGDAEVCLAGSRLRILGRSIERKWHRHLVGRVFSNLTNLILGLGAYDTQCGFKLVPRVAYERVRPRLGERRFSFDVELLVLLLGSGCAVREVPIDWADRGHSTVRLWRDIPAMAAGLWRTRRHL